MKTLVNKENTAIRIVAPEIETGTHGYYYIGNVGYHKDHWTLLEEEPEKLHIDRPRGYKLASEDATANGFNQPKEPVDLDEIALEKYPIQMVAKDPFDDEDDTKEDLNEYEREAYLEGLKKGYELGLKARKEESK